MWSRLVMPQRRVRASICFGLRIRARSRWRDDRLPLTRFRLWPPSATHRARRSVDHACPSSWQTSPPAGPVRDTDGYGVLWKQAEFSAAAVRAPGRRREPLHRLSTRGMPQNFGAWCVDAPASHRAQGHRRQTPPIFRTTATGPWRLEFVHRSLQTVCKTQKEENPATKLIARFPDCDWCRRDESNTRPSHYE